MTADNIKYDIRHFSWDKEIRTLTSHIDTLYPTESCKYTSPFPNQRGKFYIYNFNTKNFRRFIIVKDNGSYMLFKSEDDIFCKIFK
jgi:hypothetical protein